MKKKIILHPISFDQYLWDCFLELLEHNHELTPDGGKRLKDGVEFNWQNAKNRNPMVVDELWKEILLKHLRHYGYN